MTNINKEEYSVIKCKHCGNEKIRYRAGRYPSGKDIRYVDEHGKQFNGLTCPDCVREKVKLRKRNNASIRKMAAENV